MRRALSLSVRGQSSAPGSLRCLAAEASGAAGGQAETAQTAETGAGAPREGVGRGRGRATSALLQRVLATPTTAASSAASSTSRVDAGAASSLQRPQQRTRRVQVTPAGAERAAQSEAAGAAGAPVQAAPAPLSGPARVFTSRKQAQTPVAAAPESGASRSAESRPRLRRDPVTGDLVREGSESALDATPGLGLVKQRERSRRMDDASVFSALGSGARGRTGQQAQSQQPRRTQSAPPTRSSSSRRPGERKQSRLPPMPVKTAEMIADERAIQQRKAMEYFTDLAFDVELDVTHAGMLPQHWHEMPSSRMPSAQEAAAALQENTEWLRPMVEAPTDAAWARLTRAAVLSYETYLRAEAKDRRKRGMSDLPHGAAEDAALAEQVHKAEASLPAEVRPFAQKALLTLQHNPRWSFQAKDRALKFMATQLAQVSQTQ